MTPNILPLYFRMPVFVQNLASSAYGLRLRFLRYGGTHQKTLSDLRDSQWLPSKEIEANQVAELSRAVETASRLVPLYQEKGLEPLPLTSLEALLDLPIVTKEDLRSPRERLINQTFANRRTYEIHTSGTTGSPLTIYCDRDTLQRNYAFFSRFLEWAGVRAGVRTATFAGRTIVSPSAKRGPYWRRNRGMNQLLFSSYHLSEKTIPDYVEALSAFKPEVIDAYPSSLQPIARFLVDEEIGAVRPRAVVTSSETLSPDVRSLIEAAFGCPVFDFYAAAEMAALITQCEQGSYHANPEFGVVEILQDGVPAAPGEVGEIVATGFINPVMPLIRYATGDRAAFRPGSCPCGRHFPMLERIEGRQDEVLTTPDGRLIGRLDPIFKDVDSIYESRIVQDRIDHVRVELVPAPSFSPDDAAVIRTNLERRMGPEVGIEVVQVDELPRSRSGKLRAVVNEVQHAQE